MNYHNYPSYIGQPYRYDRSLPIPIIGWTEEVNGISLPILAPETAEYRAELDRIDETQSPYRGPSYTADELDELDERCNDNEAERANRYLRQADF